MHIYDFYIFIISVLNMFIVSTRAHTGSKKLHGLSLNS